jgi:membrane protein YdbS with pleckstrin-like domain
MTKERTKKTRKKRMRSYRKIMQFLWAFGMAGLGLGGILAVWFGLKHQWKLAAWGVVYILVATILLGIRNILAYLDSERKRKQRVYSGPRPV